MKALQSTPVIRSQPTPLRSSRSGSGHSPLQSGFWCHVLRTCIVLLGTLGYGNIASADADLRNYLIPLAGGIPSDGATAITSTQARADSVIKFMACGKEEDYLESATLWTRPDDKPRFADAEEVEEGPLQQTIAKMIVYANFAHYASGSPTAIVTCSQAATSLAILQLWPPGGDKPDGTPLLRPELKGTGRDTPDALTFRMTELQRRITSTFGTVCAGTVVVGSPVLVSGLATVTYGLSRECLRTQINRYLRLAYVNGQLGSSDLPCYPYLSGATHGEWDFKVKDLTRIYFLNSQLAEEAPLDEDVRVHIRNDLLTLDGGTGKESYSIVECGNQEYSVGPPDDRADDQSWTNQALGDVGDALDWLAKWLAILALLALGLLVAGAVLATLVGPSAAGVIIALAGAAGVVALTFADIPETENHRLMIESSRYLNNQIILKEIDPSNSNKDQIASEQASVREWLLKRLRRIAVEDFLEYNARPYQHYSLAAIRNIADFAEDGELHVAAYNVLDLDMAKFAIGSNQGRRLVPFRRHMEDIQQFIEPGGKDGNFVAHNGIQDQERESDHSVAAMMLYAGQVQQPTGGQITSAAVNEMLLPAVSQYRPPQSVLDVATGSLPAAPPGGMAERPLFQAVRHSGVEIYSKTSGFLITAGGITAPPAYTIEVAGASLGARFGPLALSKNSDRGAALPTTLMLSAVAGSGRTSLETFLRIEGPRKTLDSDNVTYDHNLCVARGFACGINVIAPPDMEPCFIKDPSDPPAMADNWRFFDSAACVPYMNGPDIMNGPHVMIARYLEDCHGDTTGDCTSNVGLFEVASLPSIDFQKFINLVKTNNSNAAAWLSLIGGGLLGSNRTVLNGTYVTILGDRIEFDTSAHQRDGDRSGIVSVNGVATPKISDWARAAGDFMTSDGSNRYRFVNPATGSGFSVDMSDWANPKRTNF
jgi:hypothetical protein